jgi:mRNA interferase HicA
MRSRLPALTAREVIRALERYGFEQERQTGSHLTLRHPTLARKAVVPVHRGTLRRRTLFNIIRQAGIAPQDFMELL